MSRVVVSGAGVCGLIGAMALARDGHEVTVLERDPALPPAPERAWDDWERRGVNHFWLAHFALPGFRAILETELPDVVDALERAGAYRFHFFGDGGAAMDPGRKFEVLTARRPVLEAAVSAAAAATLGLTVRRGTGVAGLVRGTSQHEGAPHITGVRTEAGEEVAADLVLDATGRRSPLRRWLEDLGGQPPYEEEEDSGFVYYGRYLATRDGSQPFGPSLSHHGSISLLVLPADRGTVGVVLISSSGDAALRALRDDGPWDRVVRSLPMGRSLLRAAPISPLLSMSKIEDRYRRMVVDGAPVATGVIPIADSFACTNPTLGRGMTLGARHVMAVRDAVRKVGLEDPTALALAVDEVTERDLTPWYRSTVWHDRHRLADIAAAAGLGPTNDDPAWRRYTKLQALMAGDFELLMRFVQTLSLEVRPEDLVDDPEVIARLDAAGDVPVAAGPNRDELLALLAG